MKVNRVLLVNDKDCMGCSACEIACKQEHGVPVGPRWIRVHENRLRALGVGRQTRYVVVHCLHCNHPACRDVCPVAAITKRDDGVVLVEGSLCVGCMACVEACPFGAMQFDNSHGVAQKCNLCLDRVDRGLQPACVAACPGRCLSLGNVDEAAQRAIEQRLLAWHRAVSA